MRDLNTGNEEEPHFPVCEEEGYRVAKTKTMLDPESIAEHLCIWLIKPL